MDFREAISIARRGNSLLFLGAGASWGAKNNAGGGLPTGPKLASKLATAVSMDEDTALDRLADFYIEDFGTSSLIDMLKSALTATEIADHHTHIASNEWMRVYTTNYDNVFEMARAKAGRSSTTAVLSDRPETLLSLNDCCLHINGSIETLSESTLQTQFKLSTTSYLTQHFQESEWVDVFRTDLRLADAIIFVGYSMYDLDIQRIIFETPKTRAKTFFVVAKDERRDSERILTRFGSVEKIGVDYFGRLMHEELRKPVHAPIPHRILRKWLQFQPPEPSRRPVQEDDILKLLLWGSVDDGLEEHDATSMNSGGYFFHRRAVAHVVERLKEERSSVIVHSHLGNGKSIVQRQVVRAMFDEGFDVFTLLVNDEESNKEARKLVSIADKPTVVCIPNYAACIDLLNDITTIPNRHVRFLLCARSSANDVSFSVLRESFRSRTTEISVNRVHADDIPEIIKYFTTYALWQSFSGESDEGKKRLIQNDCRSEISAILMLLMKSPQIEHRLNEVLDAFRADDALCAALIAVMILNSIGQSFTADTLLDLVDPELPRRLRQNKNSRVREIVNIEGGYVAARSSVAASFLLQQVFTPQQVLPVLLRLTTEASKRIYVHEELLIELVRFANVQSVLAHGKGRLSWAVHFYESAQKISWLNESIHFWLQYGVARLSLQSSLSDIEHAERYFMTAYAKTKKIDGYNTNKIDNHFARLLLVKAQYAECFDGWYELWTDARDKLLRQVGRQKELHYPYKVAAEAVNLFEQISPRISEYERFDMLRFFQLVIESIDALSEETRSHFSVRDCKRRMERILDQNDLTIS